MARKGEGGKTFLFLEVTHSKREGKGGREKTGSLGRKRTRALLEEGYLLTYEDQDAWTREKVLSARGLRKGLDRTSRILGEGLDQVE